ncbi:helix-turn-helix transcriptional regulator [Arcticibacter tournemirensis]|uniref:Helix-turn-helix transcriptional regulator n=1 Tax=Arcticibacter tournemirensis TaxID=699437 RepID=A0A5M9HGG0_9SPHI|nr:helix-turn-helix transcriptional regulator [Arcticibacter tournemirensis]
MKQPSYASGGRFPAKKLGVHALVIARYERGEVKPSIETAARMAETLGVSAGT